MKHAVIIDAVRTPVGRASADKGYFRDVRSEDLSAHVMRALIERTGIEPRLIEDVRWGCVQQQGEQGFDDRPDRRARRRLARRGRRRDDQPQLRVEPSSDQRRRHEHRRGCEDVQIAGGVEHMDHVPMTKDYNPYPGALPQAQRGDHEHGSDGRIPRRQVPDFPRETGRIRLPQPPTRRRRHRKGRVPGRGRSDLGTRRRRPEGLAHARTSASAATRRSQRWPRLPPAFNPAGGSVTAGNSSPINVGAAALL